MQRRIYALAVFREMRGLVSQRTHVACRHVQQLALVPRAICEAAPEGRLALDEDHTRAECSALAKNLDGGQGAGVPGAYDANCGTHPRASSKGNDMRRAPKNIKQNLARGAQTRPRPLRAQA